MLLDSGHFMRHGGNTQKVIDNNVKNISKNEEITETITCKISNHSN